MVGRRLRPGALVAGALVAGTALAVVVYRGDSGAAAGHAASHGRPDAVTELPRAGQSTSEALPGAPPLPAELVAELRAAHAGSHTQETPSRTPR